MEEKFMTAKQVSTDFFNGNCNYQKVLRLTRQGKLPAMRMGNSYLFSKQALENWVNQNFFKPYWSKIKM